MTWLSLLARVAGRIAAADGDRNQHLPSAEAQVGTPHSRHARACGSATWSAASEQAIDEVSGAAAIDFFEQRHRRSGRSDEMKAAVVHGAAGHVHGLAAGVDQLAIDKLDATAIQVVQDDAFHADNASAIAPGERKPPARSSREDDDFGQHETALAVARDAAVEGPLCRQLARLPLEREPHFTRSF